MDIGSPIRRHVVIPATEPITAPEPATPKPQRRETAPEPRQPAKAPERV